MPADITGTTVFIEDPQEGLRSQFHRGPVFSALLLADEINRASPRTQSALLEAMQEGTVTIAGGHTSFRGRSAYSPPRTRSRCTGHTRCQKLSSTASC